MNNLNNLGNIYSEQEKLDLAEQHYLKAIHIQNNINGEDNLNAVTSYGNLGILCEK